MPPLLTHRSRTGATMSLFFLGPLLFAGCLDIGNDTPVPLAAISLTPSAERLSRRAYEGAPPVIPHPPLGASCTQCHTPIGEPRPPLGFAPANPHAKTSDPGRFTNCRQCHLFKRDTTPLANSFAGWTNPRQHGTRLYPSAPPTIPHPVFMREDCAACHTGPAARPEVRCSHPLRTNCRQCHVPAANPLRTLTTDIGAAGKTTPVSSGSPSSR